MRKMIKTDVLKFRAKNMKKNTKFILSLVLYDMDVAEKYFLSLKF